jgi:hypothetical protein
MKEETLLDGFSSMDSMSHIAIKVNNQCIHFDADNGFGTLMTNPLKTYNGMTVGERNRAALHRRLDAWLDGTWEENHDD